VWTRQATLQKGCFGPAPSPDHLESRLQHQIIDRKVFLVHGLLGAGAED
jgi:hypothetical protein